MTEEPKGGLTPVYIRGVLSEGGIPLFVHTFYDTSGKRLFDIQIISSIAASIGEQLYFDKKQAVWYT